MKTMVHEQLVFVEGGGDLCALSLGLGGGVIRYSVSLHGMLIGGAIVAFGCLADWAMA